VLRDGILLALQRVGVISGDEGDSSGTTMTPAEMVERLDEALLELGREAADVQAQVWWWW